MLCWRTVFSLCVVRTLGRFADVADGEDKIPLQNVDARILAKVIEYMKYHYKLTETPQPEDEVRRWDREFVRVDKSTLFHLVLVRSFEQFLARWTLLQGLWLNRCYFGLLLDAVLSVVPFEICSFARVVSALAMSGPLAGGCSN